MTMKNYTDDQIVKLLTSKDYKQRFIGEYHEVRNRAIKLDAFLDRYDRGDSGMSPDCPYALLNAQSNAMWTYLSVLETRAQMEQIDL